MKKLKDSAESGVDEIKTVQCRDGKGTMRNTGSVYNNSAVFLPEEVPVRTAKREKSGCCVIGVQDLESGVREGSVMIKYIRKMKTSFADSKGIGVEKCNTKGYKYYRKIYIIPRFLISQAWKPLLCSALRAIRNLGYTAVPPLSLPAIPCQSV